MTRTIDSSPPHAEPVPGRRPSKGAPSALFSLADLGTWEWELATGRVRWNEAHHRICGIAPSAFSGDAEQFFSTVHPDDVARLRATLDEAMRTRTEHRAAYRIRRVDTGEIRDVEGYGAFVYDDGGTAVRGSGYLLDVTERKRQADEAHETAQRLTMAAEAVGDGLWDWNVEEGRVYQSALSLQLLGYAPGEMPEDAESRFALVHPDDLPRMRTLLEAHLAGQSPRYLSEHRMRHKDGHWIWVLDRGRVVERDTSGRPRRVVGMHTDVTRRREAEVALQESEVRFANFAEHAPVIVWVTDREGNATFINARWGELTGQPRESALGAGWFDAVHPDDRERCVAEVNEAIRARRPMHMEYRLRRADGHYVWVIDSGGPRLADDGTFLGYVGSISDVDAIRRSEQALATALERIQHQLVELEALYEATPLGLALMDPEFRYVRVNQVLAAVNGRPVEAHIGRTLREMVPNIADHVEPLYRAVLETGRPVTNIELSGETSAAPGVVRDWLASFHPVPDGHGGMLGISVVLLEVTERRHMEHALRERERLLADAQRIGRIGSWSWHVPSDRVEWSLESYRMFGVDPSIRPVSFEHYASALHPEDRERVVREVRSAIAARLPEWEAEYRILRDGDEPRYISSRTAATYDDAGRPELLQGTNLDITERVQLEARLRQAQKMEAVGQLAGGVAHDFNNLLTIINGNLEFVRRAVRGNDAVLGDLAEVERASERARTLVRQLLAFSRKQVLQPVVLDVREVVTGAEKLLRRVIGDEIALRTTLPDERLVVVADAGQLEQILLNLAVNARDAMLTPRFDHPGRGGTLSIEARLRALPQPSIDGWDSSIAPGTYVELVVHDTGHGIAPNERERIFEPFFTTKNVGEGTGLGLATVYGIVTQSGGAIRVDSAPGAGATFHILLPSASAEPRAVSTPSAPELPRGHGTILLVEDEPMVRSTARRFLEQHGYRVLEAHNGTWALALWRDNLREVRAVVTDLRMPELGGRELVAKLRSDAPTLPVVFVSGYSEHVERAPDGVRVAYLDKPFSGDALLAALDSVLGSQH